MSRLFSLFIAIITPLVLVAQDEEVVVYASLDDQRESQSMGATVLVNPQEKNPGYIHFQDISRQLVNFNFSGEGSRSRYFQIRGIGEREQYEGAPNASVGFIVDEIDLTGIAMATNLYGVEQVELLRGSQSTINGSNALAGIVYFKSDAPAEEFALNTQLQAGNDQLVSYGLKTNLFFPNNSLGIRLATQNMSQNGFMDNQYYEREDTNERDESITRVNLSYDPSDRYSLYLNIINANLDNGYDAWSNENIRVTQSDFLGRDTQALLGFSVVNTVQLSPFISTKLTYANADSDMLISYDGDWGNDSYWGGTLYDFTSTTNRNRKQDSLDLLFHGNQLQGLGSLTYWALGFYFKDVYEDNEIEEFYNGETYKSLDSEFKATHQAAYGSLSFALSSLLQLELGLRAEGYEFNYYDNNLSLEGLDKSNVGGLIKLTYDLSDGHSLFAILNKGYKFGGVNIGVDVPQSLRTYGDEELLGLELGSINYLAGGRIRQKTNLFVSRRKNQQISTSYQLDPLDPLSFIYITDNASEGLNSGIETEWTFVISEHLSSVISLGLLDAAFENYNGDRQELEGRQQSYAPKMQLSSSLSYVHPQGYFGNLMFFAQSDYYFDDSHDQKADAYWLVDLTFGYNKESATYTFWIKNALDMEYATRGFYFANDPNDASWTPHLFKRFGDPRQFGFTVDYVFQ